MHILVPIFGSSMWKSETLSSVISFELPICREREKKHTYIVVKINYKKKKNFINFHKLQGQTGKHFHLPLQDSRRQHGTRPIHPVSIYIESCRTVAVDEDPIVYILLHDRDCGALVQLIIGGFQSMSSGQKWAKERQQNPHSKLEPEP